MVHPTKLEDIQRSLHNPPPPFPVGSQHSFTFPVGSQHSFTFPAIQNPPPPPPFSPSIIAFSDPFSGSGGSTSTSQQSGWWSSSSTDVQIPDFAPLSGTKTTSGGVEISRSDKKGCNLIKRRPTFGSSSTSIFRRRGRGRDENGDGGMGGRASHMEDGWATVPYRLALG
ncbi:hypothetical protein HanIR_Chr17g0872881 [Helianthus annuus]|nr:hypothetical protein HanIR_Chr17g0872881 [Helianthus annuus]